MTRDLRSGLPSVGSTSLAAALIANPIPVMKRLLIALTAATLSLNFAACTSTPTSGSAETAKANRPVRLQVTVDVPPSIDILRDDDIAEAFAYRVSSALHEQGIKGRIRYVEFGDDLTAGAPVLAIMLREWRVDRIGGVNCIFSATLKNGSTSKELGLFSGSSMMIWSRRDWYARQEGFEDAAADALNNLGARVLKSGLLPEMTPPVRSPKPSI